MNRGDIEKMMKNQSGMTQVLANRCIEAFCEVVAMSLACDEPVSIRDFGKFHTYERPGQNQGHPGTGAALWVPPRKMVMFVASHSLRDRLNLRED